MNKLTQEEVKQIYTSTKTQKELAKQYNVSIPHISDIMNRKSHIKITGGLKSLLEINIIMNQKYLNKLLSIFLNLMNLLIILLRNII
ncbi:transcriptional repressor [Staphylococcus phage S-CoN_Ph11]|nr:transcriptional repressor [Staphylococcus phage S-CoN_Ph11]